jgi:hypothetical protein
VRTEAETRLKIVRGEQQMQGACEERNGE